MYLSNNKDLNDAYCVEVWNSSKPECTLTPYLSSLVLHTQVLCKDINQDEAVAYGATVQVRRGDEERRDGELHALSFGC